MFSTHLENLLPFSSKLKLSSAKSFSLEESKICRLGKVKKKRILIYILLNNYDDFLDVIHHKDSLSGHGSNICLVTKQSRL